MGTHRTGAALFIVVLLLIVVQVQAVLPAGDIVVHSTPAGAFACIDTVDCNYTTATFTASADAWHTVTVIQDGYQQWTDTVYVTSGQTSVVVADLQLNPDATVIQVYVNPGGGRVCLDTTRCDTNAGTSNGIGSTRFTGVSAGPHTISVETDGFRTYTEQVYASIGATSTVHIDLVPLSTPTGKIQVISTPDGATACVDGGNCLVAPVTFSGLNSGTYHTVVVALTGYQTYTENVYVVVDQTTLVRANLKPATGIYGTVRVSVNRIGSTICIDGTSCHPDVGGKAGEATVTTDFTGVTADTMHTIDVSAAEFEPVSVQVTVSPDQVNVVNVTLTPIVTTTLPTPSPTPSPTPVPPAPVPTPLQTKAGYGPFLPLVGLTLCGAIILVRKIRK